jgi:hypothetical protein
MALPVKSLASKFGKGALTAQITAYEFWARLIARGIQFVFAIIVCAIYGRRVDVDRRAGASQSTEWVYALLVGGLSCITCIIFMLPIPLIKSHRLFACDLFIFILWIACFGTFARLYLNLPDGAPAFNGTNNTVMKTAVWVDLVNAVLWMLTGMYGVIRTLLAKKIDQKVAQTKEAAHQKVAATKEAALQKLGV